MMKLSQIIPQFLSEADVQYKSMTMYKYAIEKFFRWVHANRLDPDKLGRADIISYKTELQSSSLSVSSVKNYLTVVRIFYRWANQNNIHDDITLGVRSPRYDNSYKKYPLNREQTEQLFQSINDSTNTGKRDRILIRLMVFNGLRRIEVSRINIGDINPDSCSISIQGKGSIDKTPITITQETLDQINEYLVTRNNLDDSEPLIANRSGRRMSLDMISRTVKKYLKGIGLDSKYYTCHSLRHTTATLLLETGMPIEEIKQYLRHRSINTSLLYTRLVEEQRRLINKPGTTLEKLIQTNKITTHTTTNV